MIYFMFLVPIFFIILIFPILSSISASKKNQSIPLFIKQSEIKDPRYFAKSFCRLFDSKWKESNMNDKIMLSQEEKVLKLDKIKSFPNWKCDSIVYVERLDFEPPEGMCFEKEIYACKNVYLKNIPFVRAIACKKNMYLGEGTRIIRWADAEGVLKIGRNSELGFSISSGTRLEIGKNCVFRRLYAPEIIFSENSIKHVEDKSFFKNKRYDIFVSSAIVRNLKYVDDEKTENHIFNRSIITKYDIAILKDCIIQGSIRSHGDIELDTDTVVCGNLFAEGDIYLGKNSKVHGSIFTQGNIFIDEGVIIGEYGRIKSVISRGAIQFSDNCRVYGYISSEKTGKCSPDFIEEKENSIYLEEFKDIKARFSNLFNGSRKLIFADKIEFEKVDNRLFRENDKIEEIIIPEGIKKIKPGSFFKCTNLKSITIPSTLEEIGDYVFFGCHKLEEIKTSKNNELKVIGDSAFEGCSSLRHFQIPSSISSIGTAAFYDCNKLEKVDLRAQSQLKKISNHAFQYCRNLKEIIIPEAVKTIGMSAFYGCESIHFILLPSSTIEIDRYAFYGCMKLENIQIESEEVIIGEHAFDNCDDKLYIEARNEVVREVVEKIADKQITVIIDDDFDKIGEWKVV